MKFSKTKEFNNTIREQLDTFQVTHILKNHNIAISGSFVLNILQSKSTIISDLDIYMKINTMSNNKLLDIIGEFFIKGYRLKEYDYNKINYFNNLSSNDLYIPSAIPEEYKDNYINVLKELKYYKRHYNTPSIFNTVPQLFDRIKYKQHVINNDISLDYFSLKDHVYDIIKFYNKEIKKEIDLIIINDSSNIKKILLETFDYDIVKNYIKYESNTFITYYLKKNIKTTQKAKMTTNHFLTRICDNFHEFNNFIHRYYKYKYTKGYDLFIDNKELTNEWICELLNIVYNNLIIKLRDVDLYKHLKYKCNILKINHVKINSSHSIYKNKPFMVILEFQKYYNSRTEFIHLLIDNPRLFINEYYCNKIFQKKNIADHLRSIFWKDEINKISKKLITNAEFNKFFNNFQLVPINISVSSNLTKFTPMNIDLCCVCLNEESKIFDIHCGQNHKLCKNCIININKQNITTCPMCRAPIFEK